MCTIIYFRGYFWYFSHFKPYINTCRPNPLCGNRCGKLEDVNIFNFFLRVRAGAAPAPTGITVQGLYGRFRVFRGDVCREIGCTKMLAICCIQSLLHSKKYIKYILYNDQRMTGIHTTITSFKKTLCEPQPSNRPLHMTSSYPGDYAYMLRCYT